MNNPKFIRLIKLWHPDTTTNTRKKAICEEMTKCILRANDECDDTALEEIDRLGERYLEISRDRKAQEEEDRRSDLEVREAYRKFRQMQEDEEDSQGGWAAAYPIHAPRQNYTAELFGLMSPYLLPMVMGGWGKNGRILNLWALSNAAAWVYLWCGLWYQLGLFESATLAAGHAHDGGVALLFVLARGAMILAILPVAVPLGLLAAFAALGTGLAWLCAWILGGIMEFFHPWLVPVPYVAATVVLLIAAWESLGEGLDAW